MINKFYLDKEKDIIVNLYRTREDEITYVLETPNHNTGNLITNLAQICGLETIKNGQDKKIITGKISASINGNNEEVYIFRLGGIKIANIYEDRIRIKGKIPAITKTLMSQTKNYKLPINKTIVKTYIVKKIKIQNRFAYTCKCKFITRLFNSIRNNASSKISIILYKKIKSKIKPRTRRKNI